MKVIEEFTENCRQETLHADRRAYVATWEASPGFVEVPGISEIAVRVDGTDDRHLQTDTGPRPE